MSKLTEYQDTYQPIGFIGLGIMGKPMSLNLLKAGYDLLVYDIDENRMAESVKAGAKGAGSIEEIACSCKIIITMLPNSPQVSEVVLGAKGLLDCCAEDTLFIDMSSISPLVSRQIGEKLAAKKIRMLDAPVSGGEPKAIDGSLSVMVGGRMEDFEEALPILEKMGKSVVRTGDLGAGNTTKLANQVVVALNIAALSEALVLAEKAGVEPELVYNAIRGGLAGSTVMDAKAPMMLDHNFKPGFKIDLHIKDLTNALDVAKELGVPLMLTSQVLQMMNVLHEKGDGQSDHSALIKFYEQITDTKIHRKKE
ncbi:MAG: 2-hydroxy-3-oxopropionate reductase [Saccharofermentanales bacterium]